MSIHRAAVVSGAGADARSRSAAAPVPGRSGRPGAAKSSGRRPLVLYDGDCGFCRWIVRRFGWVLRRRGFLFARAQDAWVPRRFGIPPARLLDEFRVVDADGSVAGGGDGLVALGRHVRGWRALWVVGRTRRG